MSVSSKFQTQQACLSLVSARNPTEESYSLFHMGYSLWHQVWDATLRELDGISTLYSDQFTRNEFMAIITIREAPAALCCFRTIDLTSDCQRSDSWFSVWPKALISNLSLIHETALIPSWLTVAPQFRRSAGYDQLNLTLVLAELIALNCLECEVDIAFGTPRKDRSVHKAITQAGSRVLASDIIHHGVPVDLVGFFPQDLRHKQFSRETLDLWQQRSDLRPIEIRNATKGRNNNAHEHQPTIQPRNQQDLSDNDQPTLGESGLL